MHYNKWVDTSRMILKGALTHTVEAGLSETGNITRLDNCLNEFETLIRDEKARIQKCEQSAVEMRAEFSKPFAHQLKLAQLRKRLGELNAELNISREEELAADGLEKESA